MPCKFDADPDRVFDEAYGVRLNYKKMKKLEKEYTTMKVKEKEDEIELRVSNSFWKRSIAEIWLRTSAQASGDCLSEATQYAQRTVQSEREITLPFVGGVR